MPIYCPKPELAHLLTQIWKGEREAKKKFYRMENPTRHFSSEKRILTKAEKLSKAYQRVNLFLYTKLYIISAVFLWFHLSFFSCRYVGSQWTVGIFRPLIWKGGTDWEKWGSKNWYIFWQKLTNHPSFVSCLINRKWVAQLGNYTKEC